MISKSNCTIIETAITPNGDGQNERLELLEIVDLEQFTNNRIDIFNRWGQTVFTTSPYRRDWTGTDRNGQELPVGDYFFIVQVNVADGKCFMGSVYLTR